jgi:hypothetical protein
LTSPHDSLSSGGLTSMRASFPAPHLSSQNWTEWSLLLPSVAPEKWDACRFHRRSLASSSHPSDSACNDLAATRLRLYLPNANNDVHNRLIANPVLKNILVQGKSDGSTD